MKYYVLERVFNANSGSWWSSYCLSGQPFLSRAGAEAYAAVRRREAARSVFYEVVAEE